MGKPTGQPHRLRRLALCHAVLPALCLAQTGCDRFGSGTTVSAPSIVLTRAEPIATYEVVLCLDGPDMGTMHPEAAVHGATAAGTDASGGLGVTATVHGQGGSRRQGLGGYQDHPEQFGFTIESAGPWSDRSGLRCAPPQTITFELQPESAAETMELEWTIGFRTEFQGLFVGMDDVRANENSVRVHRTG